MDTAVITRIPMRELQIGDILLNLGCVVYNEEYANCWRVRYVDAYGNNEFKTFKKFDYVHVKRLAHENNVASG